MHEVHLVEAIVEAVEKEVSERGAKRATLIRIRCNALTSHSGDHVRFSFDLVKKDRPLVQDAELQLNELDPLLHCNECGNEFPGHQLPDVCPECGALAVESVNPIDMALESFEIER